MGDLQEMLEKFTDRRRRRAEERMRLSKRLIELNAEEERDAITVSNLKAIFSPQDDREPNVGHEIEPVDTPSAAARQQSEKVAPHLVKDIVLAIIRDAYPEGLTAKQIRGKAFLRYRQSINPNTLTVSLVRYSKGDHPKARCEGRTWYYVPAKISAAAAAERKSPETPGLL